MEKKILVCIGTDEEKVMWARLSLLVVDGDEVITRQYHKIIIEPGADLASLRQANELHISRPGSIPGAPWPAIPDSEWADVEAYCALYHTEERCAAFAAKKEFIERIQREVEAAAQERQALVNAVTEAAQGSAEESAARQALQAAVVDSALTVIEEAAK